MLPNVILEGHKVRLRAVDEKDLPLFVKWLNDAEVSRWLALPKGPPRSLEEEYRWFASVKEETRQIVWAIESLDAVLLGNLVLHLRTARPESGEMGLFIGVKERWSQGLGADAIRTFLSHAFGAIGLHRVDLVTDEENLRAQRCFEKCGFRREGYSREYRRRWVDGQFINGVLMAVLAHEFLPATGDRVD